nr:hypothetical protein [uncultured Rhodopila sp.]
MSDIEFPNRRKLAAKLDAIAPSADRHPPDDRVDAAASRHGFVSREPEEPFKRERIGPVVTLHTRAPVRVATPFQRFCDANRFSYWEGIEELMKRAGVV